MLSYAVQSLERYEQQRNGDPENVKPTLLTKLYESVDDGTYAREQLVVDARTNIIAGTDTTAVTATYAVWLLAHYPQVEYDLVRAVSTLPSDFSDEDLREIKLLNNVVQETLRLHGAVGSALPRVVPAGGAEFCGHFVPEGITVGLQAWTMHRKPEVWAHPEVFDPSRWDAPTKEMKDCFVAFGGGSRSQLISTLPQHNNSWRTDGSHSLHRHALGSTGTEACAGKLLPCLYRWCQGCFRRWVQ